MPRIRGATIGLIICVGLSSAIAFLATCTAGTMVGAGLVLFGSGHQGQEPGKAVVAAIDSAILNFILIGLPVGTIVAILVAVRVKRAILSDRKPPRIQPEPPERR